MISVCNSIRLAMSKDCSVTRAGSAKSFATSVSISRRLVSTLIDLLHQVDDLGERGHAELAVELGAAGALLGDALAGVEGLDLGQREVLGPPVGRGLAVQHLGDAAVGELGVVGDVGGAAQQRLVAGDQHAVLGDHEVGLDDVGATGNGDAVGFQRVLGAQAAGAAVADDQRRLAVEGVEGDHVVVVPVLASLGAPAFLPSRVR